MKAYTYIIFSKSLNRFYVGVTHETPVERLENHNKHSYGNHRFTAIANDWEIFLIIEVDNYSHAVRLERKIKAMKSKTFIQNLRKYPELVQKIIKETSAW